MKLTHAETVVIKLIATMVFIIGLSAYFKGIHIRLDLFDLAICLDLILILAGQYFRSFRKMESLAVTLTVFGLSLLTGQLVTALNYMYLPYSFHGFDQTLAAIDGLFGFVWSDFAKAFVAWPQATDFLRTVYGSSQNQIILLVIILGCARKTRDLEEFMLVLTIGVLACVSLWALFPSSSPIGFQPLSAEIADQLKLIVNAESGAKLVGLSHEGITTYPPKGGLEGLVGFPSFHTVMLIATVYAARSIKIAFWPLLIWNLLMFPAITLHGAHNITDIFGGLAVAAFSIYCAHKIMRRQAVVPKWLHENGHENQSGDLTVRPLNV